jgi:purine-binding chemotaxis protein CheW
MTGQTARSEFSSTELAGKYLTFALGAEEYGLPVLKVREIIKMMSITSVPQVPDHVRGVINLRGKVIPVIDLRIKFGFGSKEYTARTCIIVVEIAVAQVRTLMGIIVDRVSEVLNISADEIGPVPEFGQGVETTNMQGIATVKGQVKVLIDVDCVLGTDGPSVGSWSEAVR